MKNNQSLFDAFAPAREKGGSEWSVFNAVTHDRTSLLLAETQHRPQQRTPTAIKFGSSRLFVLKRA